tara:strand:+ start:1620 stop:2096 length:477 start_codon:yes stop_codon:yes gene_type:complete
MYTNANDKLESITFITLRMREQAARYHDAMDAASSSNAEMAGFLKGVDSLMLYADMLDKAMAEPIGDASKAYVRPDSVTTNAIKAVLSLPAGNRYEPIGTFVGTLLEFRGYPAAGWEMPGWVEVFELVMHLHAGRITIGKFVERLNEMLPARSAVSAA